MSETRRIDITIEVIENKLLSNFKVIGFNYYELVGLLTEVIRDKMEEQNQIRKEIAVKAAEPAQRTENPSLPQE